MALLGNIEDLNVGEGKEYEGEYQEGTSGSYDNNMQIGKKVAPANLDRYLAILDHKRSKQ